LCCDSFCVYRDPARACCDSFCVCCDPARTYCVSFFVCCVPAGVCRDPVCAYCDSFCLCRGPAGMCCNSFWRAPRLCLCALQLILRTPRSCLRVLRSFCVCRDPACARCDSFCVHRDPACVYYDSFCVGRNPACACYDSFCVHRDQAHACYDSFCVGRDLACVGAMTQSACAAYLLVLTVCTASLLPRAASLSLAACGPNRFVRAVTLQRVHCPGQQALRSGLQYRSIYVHLYALGPTVSCWYSLTAPDQLNFKYKKRESESIRIQAALLRKDILTSIAHRQSPQAHTTHLPTFCVTLLDDQYS
jgi:hypothetical protein